MNPHPFIPSKRGPACQICGSWADASYHNRELFTGADLAREEARALAHAEELSAELKRPLKDISTASGILERESPLFFGTGNNPTLF